MKNKQVNKNVKSLRQKISSFFVPKSKQFAPEIQHKNGTTAFYYVKVSNNDTFRLFGKEYIVDSEYIVYNSSIKMYTSLYHEDLSLPVEKKIPVKELLVELKNNTTNSRVINNCDPNVLRHWNASKVIQDTIQGQKNKNEGMQITVMLWVIGIMSLVTLLIVAQQSGIFT
jgi:hypothetical protein